MSDAPLRTPEGFSEMATALGVASAAGKRKEMLDYAFNFFPEHHSSLLNRILKGYQRAKKMQLGGMVVYAAVALVAVVISLLILNLFLFAWGYLYFERAGVEAPCEGVNPFVEQASYYVKSEYNTGGFFKE